MAREEWVLVAVLSGLIVVMFGIWWNSQIERKIDRLWERCVGHIESLALYMSEMIVEKMSEKPEPFPGDLENESTVGKIGSVESAEVGLEKGKDMDTCCSYPGCTLTDKEHDRDMDTIGVGNDAIASELTAMRQERAKLDKITAAFRRSIE